MHHAVGKRNIGAGLYSQVYVSFLCKIRNSGIYNDQLCSAGDSLPHLHAQNRMSLFRVGAYYHNRIRLMGYVINGVRHRTRTKRLRQTGDSGCVSDAGTVIRVI